MNNGEQPADVVLVMAPIGADALNIQNFLQGAGLGARICRNAGDVQTGLGNECGGLLLTEEALTPELSRILNEFFPQQPPWSDIPIVLIASEGISHSAAVVGKLRGARRTVTLLERPLRSATLLATLHTVLAARHRQYEIRELLDERDLLLASLETRVAQRTAELRKMVEEMEAFSYSVSHDLRSPLRSVAGYAQALQEDFGDQLPPGARVYLEKIERAARRMDNLTQDVLAYTRATRCEMEITVVDLDTLFTEVIEQYPALDSFADRIRIRAPLGCAMGHVPSLIQCFSNLLGNAVKFSVPGRPPQIEVRASRHDRWCRVSVKDNGLGIDPADQRRIFGMFERAGSKQIPGTGIGLAIVKKAVERMGGTVGVISTPGAGSEFWIELVAADPPCPTSLPAKNADSFWNGDALRESMPATSDP